MFLTGDLLYLLVRCNGEVRYIHVQLDLEMLSCVRESIVGDEGGVYRDVQGEPTLLAAYLALIFLQRNVPAQAIRRELGMSDMAMNRLLAVWREAAGVSDRDSRSQRIRMLPFD
ncbi:hypothetical protein [Caballeronia sp. J97]|uniref:hypothetical protein n=1 Tax=Caballeronia sp. J97 TaxID=2805429 RepID=UPI002AAF7F02|nr:hypothetical protein [Caballeronia sp. J97]